MSETSTLIGYGGRTIGREELALVPTPAATETHRPIPHHEIVGALLETLGFRHIGVVHDEYAVSPDGMKLFGVLDLATEMHGCRFSIGVRNSHDKSMRLAMTVGYRVFVCSNMAFSGDFTPVLAKHSTFPSTWLGGCTTSTSSRNMKSSGRGHCGVCPTRSRLLSRSSTRSLSSRQRRNWADSWKSGSRGSSEAKRSGGRPAKSAAIVRNVMQQYRPGYRASPHVAL